MSPTGIGNYPPGVTDNDPHFDCWEDEPEIYLGDDEEQSEPQRKSWQDEYAEQVCIPRFGPI